MNKNQFIEKEIEKNKKAFGRWGSTKKRNSADEMKLSFDAPPQNKEEASQHGNALANTGYYPVGTSECFNVGISGGCGISCYIYLNDGCPDLEELIEKEHNNKILENLIDIKTNFYTINDSLTCDQVRSMPNEIAAIDKAIKDMFQSLKSLINDENESKRNERNNKILENLIVIKTNFKAIFDSLTYNQVISMPNEIDAIDTAINDIKDIIMEDQNENI